VKNRINLPDNSAVAREIEAYCLERIELAHLDLESRENDHPDFQRGAINELRQLIQHLKHPHAGN